MKITVLRVDYWPHSESVSANCFTFRLFCLRCVENTISSIKGRFTAPTHCECDIQGVAMNPQHVAPLQLEAVRRDDRLSLREIYQLTMRHPRTRRGGLRCIWNQAVVMWVLHGCFFFLKSITV